MPVIRAKPKQPGLSVIASSTDSDLRYLSFGLVALGEGEQWQRTFAHQETVLVVLGGRCDVAAGGNKWEGIGERGDVFGGRPTAAYLPPGCPFEVRGRSDVEVAVCGGRAQGGRRGRPGEPALISPEQVGVRKVGEGAFYREIHDIITVDSFPAQRLIVGETYNPPGLWSSYPPHKHDTHLPPEESRLEEVYHFRFQPLQGFGLQRVYGQGFEEAYAVNDRDTAVLTRGYHPVVGAPGYRLYYLWMLAGEERVMQWREDPSHVWLSNPER